MFALIVIITTKYYLPPFVEECNHLPLLSFPTTSNSIKGNKLMAVIMVEQTCTLKAH